MPAGQLAPPVEWVARANDPDPIAMSAGGCATPDQTDDDRSACTSDRALSVGTAACETAGLASASGKSDDAEYRFRCQSCGRGFKRKAHLSRHVVSVHDRRRDFSCEHCPRTFSTNSDRLSHTRAVHLNARPHECRLCRKSFNRKAHLRAHVARVHKNDPALAGSMDF
ncbi:hypothetical protein FNF29_05202 [Cafeteria roenbergensis]|uniref:C2H2-type domain-containing protein n=1 Tax=Cafeteria roenbergensis TaxID=33653 RepID=A0A5A8CDE3_CAFRO|nr:hypothetical protein FNF29_05202 [Cafeteria roenbergensis]|eukprot:KAA0150627.1 hypothetical protein FNF29_05202 [Cafeteria roenbergensis]